MKAFIASTLAYLKARLTEVTSLAGAIGLPAIWLGYWGGAFTLSQAKYATGAAVVAYLFPQSKVFPPNNSTPPKVALAAMAVGVAAFLTGCTSAQIQTASTDAQTAIKAIQAACAAAQTAEATAKATLKGGALDTTNKVAAFVDASCTTNDAIATLAASPTSVAWLNTLTSTISTTTQLAKSP